jgi:hypothetical protein
LAGNSLPLAPLATSGGITRFSDPKVTAVPVLADSWAIGTAVGGSGISVGTAVAGTGVLVGGVVTVLAGVQAVNRNAPARRMMSNLGNILDCNFVHIFILLIGMSIEIIVIFWASKFIRLWRSLCPGQVDRWGSVSP